DFDDLFNVSLHVARALDYGTNTVEHRAACQFRPTHVVTCSHGSPWRFPRLLSFAENAGQPLGFPLLRRCLLWMSGELIDVREAAVRRGFLRFQFCRLLKIAQRLGILSGALSVAAKHERRKVEQIGGPSILRIEFVG